MEIVLRGLSSAILGHSTAFTFMLRETRQKFLGGKTVAGQSVDDIRRMQGCRGPNFAGS